MRKTEKPFNVIIILFFLLALAPALPAQAAQDETAITMEVSAGYDGYYKETDSWVPVQVTVANSGPALEGALQVITGSNPDNRVVYSTPLSLPTQSNKRVTFFVYVQGFANRLDVRLVDARGETVRAVESNRLEQRSNDSLLYGIVSTEPVGLEFLENVTGGRTEAAVARLDPEMIPAVGTALNALDVLVITHVDSGRLTAEQVAAIRGWVSTGGQLLLSGGSEWQQTTAAFADMLPVDVSGSRSVADLPALAAQTAVPFRDPGPYLVAESTLRNGELLLHEEGLPLLARQPWGRGSVYFLALDPALAPLADWDGNERLWRVVGDGVPLDSLWGRGVRNSYAAGQALNSLPGLQLPSVLWFFLFVAGYVVVVGPLNYLFLKRLRRRELAWATIPGLIFLFVALAYLTGFRLRGNDIILNQMAVAYGHSGAEEMRVDTLLGLYSPRRTTYDVHLPADVLVRPFERNFGQMDGSGNLDAVTRSGDVVLDEVRVDISGVETFIAQSYRPAPAVSGEATLQLGNSSAELQINVQNNSDLILEQAGLLFGGNFVSLGDLAPGAAATERHKLTGSQASAIAGGAVPTGPGPYGPQGPPLSAHYEQMLGTGDYHRNTEAFPRFQLLEALAAYDARPATVAAPEDNVTLIFWSEQPLLDVSLAEAEAQQQVTTLYFIDLPLAEVRAGGEGVSLPPELLNWRVLAESGVYAPSISDFYLPPGWIELEFEPWSRFAGMEVTELVLVLRQSSLPATGSNPQPGLRLWNWEEGDWDVIPNVVWGTMSIGDFEAYLGEGNRVRLRLENSSGSGINIEAVYPALTGDL